MSGAVLNRAEGITWARIPVLLPVLVLAGALRLPALGRLPFWMDEASTAGFANLSWYEMFSGLGRLETNPPAFYALEKVWGWIAGTSDFALRLPSAMAGIAGVAVVAVLAQAAFGRRAALWSGVLMATQVHHLEHSREARVYALLFLAIALGMLAARRVAAWQGGGGLWRPSAALAVLSATAMALHNTGAVAALCVFIYAGTAALHRPGPRVQRMGALVAAGLVALVLAAPSLLAIAGIAGDKENNAAWIPVPDGLTSALIELSVHALPFGTFRILPLSLIPICAALGALIIALAVGWGMWKARASADAAGMLAGMASAILLLHGASQFVPILVERTLMFSLVFFIPLLGAAMAAVPVPGRMALLTTVLGLQMPVLLAVLGPGRHDQDWSALATRLQHEVAATGWPVMVLCGFEAVSLERYLPAGDPARPVVSITPDLGARLVEEATRLMSDATPLPQNVDAATLCGVLGHQDGVLLVLRASPLLPDMRFAANRVLTAAGGTSHGETDLGKLGFERWRGVCH